VKKRIETGISFTEFSYQLLQGYDFLHLNSNYNCKLQIGGSDQWGNITTGTELIRRKGGSDSFAFTCPLLTKSDGGKFGKTESGTIWLDPTKTSPYAFYQFWLNTTDQDAKKLIRFFTLLSREEIEAIETSHDEAPHLRQLQKAIAEDVTIRVHGKEALDAAITASNILFGKSTSDDLRKLTDDQLLEIFDGVPQATIQHADIIDGLTVMDALVAKSSFLSSNGEAKRELKAGAVSINKEKVDDSFVLLPEHLINHRFVLIGKGKKNNYLLIVD
jgi:tyrosyl-tRNA synthetase